MAHTRNNVEFRKGLFVLTSCCDTLRGRGRGGRSGTIKGLPVKSPVESCNWGKNTFVSPGDQSLQVILILFDTNRSAMALEKIRKKTNELNKTHSMFAITSGTQSINMTLQHW